MTTTLRVVRPRGPEFYGCPPWCEIGGDHDSNDGDGPYCHSASR